MFHVYVYASAAATEALCFCLVRRIFCSVASSVRPVSGCSNTALCRCTWLRTVSWSQHDVASLGPRAFQRSWSSASPHVSVTDVSGVRRSADLLSTSIPTPLRVSGVTSSWRVTSLFELRLRRIVTICIQRVELYFYLFTYFRFPRILNGFRRNSVITSMVITTTEIKWGGACSVSLTIIVATPTSLSALFEFTQLSKACVNCYHAFHCNYMAHILYRFQHKAR